MNKSIEEHFVMDYLVLFHGVFIDYKELSLIKTLNSPEMLSIFIDKIVNKYQVYYKSERICENIIWIDDIEYHKFKINTNGTPYVNSIPLVLVSRLINENIK